MLSMGYAPSTLSDMLSKPERASGHYSITFDDGYESVGRLAYPILMEMRLPATVFVVSDAIGKTNAWDVKIGDRTEKMLDLSQLREMSANGIEIGSHTVSHAHLTALSDSDLAAELGDSKKAIEDLIGKPVEGFAYPYGEWDARVKDAVVQAGYRYAAATNIGALAPATDPFAIPRINMRWNTHGGRLRRKAERAQRVQITSEIR